MPGDGETRGEKQMERWVTGIQKSNGETSYLSTLGTARMGGVWLRGGSHGRSWFRGGAGGGETGLESASKAGCYSALRSRSTLLSGEASMERLLAQLCGSSAAWPLPLWEGDTTGHCFTQLVLSALPHALLAVLSACYLGTPRWVETSARHLSVCACRSHPQPTSSGSVTRIARSLE